MTESQRKQRTWCALGVAALVLANLLVLAGNRTAPVGQRYRWVCRESAAELAYTPSMYGSARLSPGGGFPGGGYRWELVEPRPLSPLPWNWLTLLAGAAPAPDPAEVIRRERPSPE